MPSNGRTARHQSTKYPSGPRGESVQPHVQQFHGRKSLHRPNSPVSRKNLWTPQSKVPVQKEHRDISGGESVEPVQQSATKHASSPTARETFNRTIRHVSTVTEETGSTLSTSMFWDSEPLISSMVPQSWGIAAPVACCTATLWAGAQTAHVPFGGAVRQFHILLIPARPPVRSY